MGITVDVAARSMNKYGEILCGDTVEMLKTPDSDVIILADGMGSGVKASILSTLTAKILGTMFAGGATLEECVNTVVQTLPIEQKRGVAYSTFSIIQVFQNGEVYSVEYDNPRCIYLSGGYLFEPPLSRRTICGKELLECRFRVNPQDTILVMSDGVTHAGVGQIGEYAFGWPWEDVAAAASELCISTHSSVRIAQGILDRCREIYEGRPRDDTTVVAIRMVPSQTVNIMTGPPKNIEDDERITEDFLRDPDAKKVVAGGTSATILSRETGRPLQVSLDYSDPDIPPMAVMEGIDLVTEGILTLRKTIELLEAWNKTEEPDSDLFAELDRKNGASMLAKMLIEECTDLVMFVGTAVNNAYQNPDLPDDLKIRKMITRRLIDAVKALGKRVTVYYY